MHLILFLTNCQIKFEALQFKTPFLPPPAFLFLTFFDNIFNDIESSILGTNNSNSQLIAGFDLYHVSEIKPCV